MPTLKIIGVYPSRPSGSSLARGAGGIVLDLYQGAFIALLKIFNEADSSRPDA
ncbi:hypothetical protein DFP91_5505 [Pseudorhodoplanes sinuspersici]|nr:hypothetical protein DFP91_5505 [Pseudorhodoplanes sinuspersici]